MTGKNYLSAGDKLAVKVRVEQLVLTVLEGSYLYLASNQSLKRGRLPGVLQDVSIRDRGLALTKSGDLVVLVSAESAIEKKASRGFVHRHALVLKREEYESIGGTPGPLLESIPAYEKFREAYMHSQSLEAIELPDSYHPQPLTQEDLEAVQSSLPTTRLLSILSNLTENSGRVVLYYEKASFDELRRLALAILCLIPPRLRSELTFGVDLSLKTSKRMDLELYRSKGTSSIPNVKSTHRFLEDLASAANCDDSARANAILTKIHRDFMLNLRDFEELTSREEAVRLSLDSYQNPEFRRWALNKLFAMKASQAGA